MVVRKKEGVRLTPRLRAQVADCSKPLTTHRGVGEEEQVGCRQEGALRCGYAEFWVPVATSRGDAR